MKSGIVSIEQFMVDLKSATGVKNLSNMKDEIATLMVRGERLINPFGAILVRKKMKLYKANGNFNGTRFRLEDDFMFLDKVGCCEDGLCEGDYFLSGMRYLVLCDGEDREDVTYTYWAIYCDENGYPYTSYNHSEALIKFIIWQWKQQDALLNNRGMRPVHELEMMFEDAAGFARGEDLFPSEEELTKMVMDNKKEMIQLWTEWERNEDGCVMCECIDDYSEVDPDAEVTPPSNTAPTITDNSSPLQLAPYQFSFTDFAEGYSDAENHLPGTLTIKTIPDGTLGSLYRLNPPSANLVEYPTNGYEMNVNNANDLYFQLNQEIWIAPDGSLIRFTGENIYNRIDELIGQGYYQQLDGCDLVFTKDLPSDIPNDTDLFFFIDAGNISINDAEVLAAAINQWYENFVATNDNFTGNLYILPTENENWLQFGSTPYTGVYSGYETDQVPVAETVDELRWIAIAKTPSNMNTDAYVPRTKAMVFSFIDETNTGYHSDKLSDGFGNIVQPTSSYVRDYNEFLDTYANYEYFKGKVLPVLLTNTEREAAFALHAVAAIEGTTLTTQQVTDLNCPADLSLLESTNPYNGFDIPGQNPMTGLTNYGWEYDVSKSGPHSAVYTNAVLDPIFDTFLAGIGISTTDTVTLTGICLTQDQICFTFSIKEISSDELESNTASFCFNVELVDIQKILWSFQLDDLNGTFDINTVDQAWLAANGVQHKEYELLASKDISFALVGRIGFAVQTGTQNLYDIYQFGINVTDKFTRQFSIGETLDVYLSNEYYTPGDQTIQLKLRT